VSGYLAETSVFVAAEQRRSPGRPPEGEARISVATLAELGVGVRMAASPKTQDDDFDVLAELSSELRVRRG
jgi:hypothetical protein